MAGFNSPSILSLNTWGKPERDWNGNLFRQAPASWYTRYVEPYAGAFSNCMVAVENGWKPEQIEACDVWAYTAALGYAYSGTPLAGMRATVDGSPVSLSGNAADDAATVPIREARNETWEEYAWLCYENRYLTLEQMAAQMLECESHTKFSTTLYGTFKQKSQMESHHTVTKVFVGGDGFEYRAF